MTMPQGQEYVETALGLIRSASTKISELNGVKEEWRSKAAAKLASITNLLAAAADRFYVKTRASLPFAKRCAEEAGKLEALLTEASSLPGPEAQQRLDAALEALEKAAKVLDERSQMQGMVIT